MKAEKAKVWKWFSVFLVFLLVAGFFSHRHVYFGFEGIQFFFPLVGFIATVAFIQIVVLLGEFLKRPTDYYREEE